ncbi:hypothetical protein [Novipirellula rosea]|uniref:hypothetical protein n=1 Tax=Novipirellula rosea TaxID=1031540 RepID=UPI0031EF2014
MTHSDGDGVNFTACLGRHDGPIWPTPYNWYKSDWMCFGDVAFARDRMGLSNDERYQTAQ